MYQSPEDGKTFRSVAVQGIYRGHIIEEVAGSSSTDMLIGAIYLRVGEWE